jgi:hypothetical protein
MVSIMGSDLDALGRRHPPVNIQAQPRAGDEKLLSFLVGKRLNHGQIVTRHVTPVKALLVPACHLASAVISAAQHCLLGRYWIASATCAV